MNIQKKTIVRYEMEVYPDGKKKYSRTIYPIEFCCHVFELFYDDIGTPFGFNNCFDTHGKPTLYLGHQNIYFCPYCGAEIKCKLVKTIKKIAKHKKVTFTDTYYVNEE